MSSQVLCHAVSQDYLFVQRFLTYRFPADKVVNEACAIWDLLVFQIICVWIRRERTWINIFIGADVTRRVRGFDFRESLRLSAACASSYLSLDWSYEFIGCTHGLNVFAMQTVNINCLGKRLAHTSLQNTTNSYQTRSRMLCLHFQTKSPKIEKTNSTLMFWCLTTAYKHLYELM